MSDVEGFEGEDTLGWRRGVSRGMSRGRGSRGRGVRRALDVEASSIDRIEGSSIDQH